jgi:hypothetical protein
VLGLKQNDDNETTPKIIFQISERKRGDVTRSGRLSLKRSPTYTLALSTLLSLTRSEQSFLISLMYR